MKIYLLMCLNDVIGDTFYFDEEEVKKEVEKGNAIIGGDCWYKTLNRNLFDVNLDSEKEYGGSGSIYTIPEFIEDCEASYLLDYDGYAYEILLNNKIVYEGAIYSSDITSDFDLRNDLLELNEKHEGLQIVWYNK